VDCSNNATKDLPTKYNKCSTKYNVVEMTQYKFVITYHSVKTKIKDFFCVNQRPPVIGTHHKKLNTPLYDVIVHEIKTSYVNIIPYKNIHYYFLF